MDKVERLVVNSKGKVIDWKSIGWHDAKSFELIKAGNTENIYQLGSNFAKEVVSQVKLEKFEDLVNLLALIRPGTKNYIKYFTGNNETQERFKGFSDPKNIFKDTKGVILFQEQVMQAAQSYLGMDKSETNQFRKELEKASSNHPMCNQERFFTDATARGLRQEDATCLYELMKEFSKFGYNKSHAVAYARVTFKTAYLKAHYPEQFQEVFKSKEQIVIDNAKGREELTPSKTNDQAAYPEEQIIPSKAAAKISLIEVSGGTYPHHNITTEDQIVNMYRQSDECHKAVLANKRLELEVAVKCYHDNKQIIDQSNQVGNNHDKLKIINSLVGKNVVEAEKYCINMVVQELNSQRSAVETPKQALDLLEKEQGFLASLHGNLKYPEHYNAHFTQLMHDAYNSVGNNNFNQLTRLVEFVEQIQDSIAVVKILGKSHNSDEAYKKLLTEYHHVTLDKINRGLDLLDSSKTFKLDKISFNCPIKFLNHLTTTKTHEFFPHEELQKIQEQVMQRHEKQLELSKEMDGPHL